MDMQKLRLNQVDRALKRVQVPPRPSGSWVRAIRTALGMTTRQLASRLCIAQSSVTALEKSEAEEKITLQTLRRAAEALDCELHYVLVPRQSLGKRIDTQAECIAMNNVSRVVHTMHLEDQVPNSATDKDAVKILKWQLLNQPWKNLWKK